MLMFKVKLITTGEIFTVYGMNGVHFMIWDRKDKSWRFVGIENFEPLEEWHMDKWRNGTWTNLKCY